MERDARRAAGLPGVEPGTEDLDKDSDSDEGILDLVPEVGRWHMSICLTALETWNTFHIWMQLRMPRMTTLQCTMRAGLPCLPLQIGSDKCIDK